MARFDLSRLRSQIKPFRLHWFARLKSTNDYAAYLRRKGRLFAPAVVLTGRQLAGRGRGSNTWWSDPGCLTVTFVLPIDEHLKPHQLPLIAGLAIRHAVALCTGVPDIQLKWPNDLLYGGRKLAGLLCERVHKADLIGLGLNIKFQDLPPRALRPHIICLSEFTAAPLDRTELLIRIAKQLHTMLLRRPEHHFGTLLREYDRHHALVNRRISVKGTPDEPTLRGICSGVDSMGRLLVRDPSGLHRIIAGQIEMD